MSMNEQWIKIEKTPNKVIVTVRLPMFDRFSNPNKIKVRTSQIEKFLKSKKIDILKCVEDPRIVRNVERGENVKTWVFDLVQKAKARKTREKTKKTLDKTPKDVIIEVEKKESPQPPEKDSALTEE